MGFLTLAGLLGTIGYMGYYAKQETKAIIGDNILKPSGIESKDKQLIKDNFKMICKRCDIKIDKNGNPIFKNHYKPCVAYLQYQGFPEKTSFYFKELYLEKYHKKYEDERKKIVEKHFNLDLHLFDEPHETKIFRNWDLGRNTQEKCEKMMRNWFWSHMVKNYNVVKDGNSNVEVWTISAPPSYLKQIDTIYDEVCTLEVYTKEI